MTMILSNLANRSYEGVWIVEITVLPFTANVSNIAARIRAFFESKPVVGSSKNITLGSTSISVAIDTLFFSPPEIPLERKPPILVCLQAVRSSHSIT